jgi:1-acyl-sn-glycerol-3-phosphate acyltransferase
MKLAVLRCRHLTSSVVDILPFSQFTPFAVMLDGGFFDAHPISRWFLKAVRHYMEPVRVEHFAGTEEQARKAQRDRIVSALKREGRPLFYFPEGWDTNGKGLLRYQRFLFGMKLPVLPTAISVSVPFHVPIRPGMLGSTIFREVMWLFFSPYYTYHIRILPAIEHDGDDETQFAARAQRITAAALGVPPTDWSKNDALVYRRSLMKPKTN